MFARTLLALTAAIGMTGCTAPPMPPPPGLDHPANPGAAEVPVPPPTDTLAIDANPVQPAPPPPDESGGPEKKVDGAEHAMPSMIHGGSMDGMSGMNGMPGMQDKKTDGPMDAMPGMNHGTPATMPAAASLPSANGGGR